ncbi:hypothetical protein PR048_026109 [Dryococelus australis]|uniref:Uncharacterized protein n=1 Tax=Dryococelus australis TaxID=614101 RepID=A0ABQ9GKF5_9NEOP|nr:hypothetical protein PR048_026109 [Dryococelus australis]
MAAKDGRKTTSKVDNKSTKGKGRSACANKRLRTTPDNKAPSISFASNVTIELVEDDWFCSVCEENVEENMQRNPDEVIDFNTSIGGPFEEVDCSIDTIPITDGSGVTVDSPSEEVDGTADVICACLHSSDGAARLVHVEQAAFFCWDQPSRTPEDEASFWPRSVENKRLWKTKGRIRLLREMSGTGMKGRGKTGDPRDNPPTSGIVRHDSHVQKNSSATPPGIDPGSHSIAASDDRARPLCDLPWLLVGRGKRPRPGSCWPISARYFDLADWRCTDDIGLLHPPRVYIPCSGATVAERLARSPPTKVNRAQSPAGSPAFGKWESCRTIPFAGRVFSGISRFPLYIHFTHPHRLSRPRCLEPQ